MNAAITANLEDLRPATVNAVIYKPVRADDPAVLELAADIRQHGLLEPLVVTTDDVIVSGHRRAVAGRLAGLSRVPVRRLDVSSAAPGFVEMLVAFNRHRVKDVAEHLREEIVRDAQRTDPAAAWRRLVQYRDQAAAVDAVTIDLKAARARRGISAGKMPFANSVVAIVEELRRWWPLSDRQVHYRLLNAPPLRHASKPRSGYRNDRASYCDLCDLLTRLRLNGSVPLAAIGDETRPYMLNEYAANAGAFIGGELTQFLRGYRRHLTQSQPNYVQVVAEKMTIQGIVAPVARKYCLPCLVGRGYSSLTPRAKIAEAFGASGRERLVLLVLSDHDPDGESIAESFARSMRDDFGIGAVTAIKVALTPEQIARHGLEPRMTAKAGSATYAEFVARHGHDVFELEAIPPAALAHELETSIAGVLDMMLFRQEQEREATDAAQIETERRAILRLAGVGSDPKPDMSDFAADRGPNT